MLFSVIAAFVLSSVSFENCGDSQQEFEFIGCVWSPSECYYSCPNSSSFKTEVDYELCPIEPASWACYCEADAQD